MLSWHNTVQVLPLARLSHNQQKATTPCDRNRPRTKIAIKPQLLQPASLASFNLKSPGTATAGVQAQQQLGTLLLPCGPTSTLVKSTRPMPAKVGIIGGGNVGQVLAKQLLKKGRSVVIGSRDPPTLLQSLAVKSLEVNVLPIAEAANQSDVLILAVPGWRDAAGAEAVATSLGPGVARKVVVDATNPLSAFPALDVLYDGTSGGELMAAALPNLYVYKALNTVGTSVMASVDGMGYPVQMMFAGPADAQPKSIAEDLLLDCGFQPRYLGPIRYARNLEAIAELWIHLAVPPAGFTQQQYGPLFSFQLQESNQQP